MPRSAAARSPRRTKRAPARRSPLHARPTKNQLPRLKANVTELKGDLNALKKPADKAHGVIEDIKKPLKLPGEIKGKVKTVKNIAKGLDAIATLCSFIPGPIGTGASALHRALEPLLGKRGVKGILDRIINALTKVENALKPVVTKLNQAEVPIDKARGELAGLLVQVGRLEMIHDTVAGHYGPNPPADVQGCLGKLNDGVEIVVKPVQVVKQKAAGPLAELAAALAQLENALKPLNDAARDVQKALNQLDSKVVRDISSVLRKIAKAVKPIRHAMDWFIEQTIGKILKALGINMKAIDRFFSNLISSLNPFKALQKTLDKLAKDLEAQVKAVPVVAVLIRTLGQLQDLEQTLEKEIEKVLRGACRATLTLEGVKSAPVSLRPSRARQIKRGR